MICLLFVDHSPWLQTPRNRDLHLCEIPQVIQEKLVTCDWHVTDRPALVIDSFQKPILLLPNRVEQLVEIHQQVHPLKAVLLSPQLKNGEQTNWLGQKLSLSKFGWSLETQEQGWELYLKK